MDIKKTFVLWLKLYFWFTFTLIISLSYFFQMLPLIFPFNSFFGFLGGTIVTLTYVSYLVYAVFSMKVILYEFISVFNEDRPGRILPKDD